MPAWPATLPPRPRYGFEEQPESNIAEFKPEVGPPKRRRRSTAAGSLCRAQYILTGSQLATLEDFYRVECADGAVSFSWNHPRTGITQSWLFDGEYVAIATSSDVYSVTLSLRRLP